jgi:hypothetical protein
LPAEPAALNVELAERLTHDHSDDHPSGHPELRDGAKE